MTATQIEDQKEKKVIHINHLNYIKPIDFAKLMNVDKLKVLIDNMAINIENKQKSPSNTTTDVVLNRGGIEYQRQEFILTFYSSLPSENSNFKGLNCHDEKLAYGMVANNQLKLHTKIYLEGMGEFVVEDRGGKNFNNNYRLDVFIPRESGESNKAYQKRVRNMGVKKVIGWIINK